MSLHVNIIAGLGLMLAVFYYLRTRTGTPGMTSLLIALNVGIYVMTAPTLIEADISVIYTFGSSGSHLAHGHFYTLVTSLFIHGNLIHLGLNMYALYFLGRISEVYLGTGRFATLYFVSGIVGNILSAMADFFVVGVGASGAILGLFGYLIALEYRFYGRVSASTVIIALFVIFGGFMANVDVLAHLGGFLFGLAWGLAGGIRRRAEVTYDISY